MPPLVSIIIPVYNDAQRLRLCLEALSKQTYRKDRIQIIVIDDASTDATPEVAQEFSVTYVRQQERSNAYVARNMGLQQANGDIIAFTDSDCIPACDWIERSVATLHAGADVCGGYIHIRPDNEQSAAQWVDAITNLRHEVSIPQRHTAFMANLCMKKTVIDTLGPLPEDTISGGDALYSARSVAKGFKLVYEPTAVVAHPARNMRSLLKKAFRVGIGKGTMWKQYRSVRGPGSVGRTRHIQHLHPVLLSQHLRTAGCSVTLWVLMKAWCISVLIVGGMALGMVYGLFIKG